MSVPAWIIAILATVLGSRPHYRSQGLGKPSGFQTIHSQEEMSSFYMTALETQIYPLEQVCECVGPS